MATSTEEPLGVRKVRVKASDGEVLPAKLSYCVVCKCDLFLIFTVEGDLHEHIQCANEKCGTVYCHGTDHCGGSRQGLS